MAEEGAEHPLYAVGVPAVEAEDDPQVRRPGRPRQRGGDTAHHSMTGIRTGLLTTSVRPPASA